MTPVPGRALLPAAILITFVTGASGLILEVLWARQLELETGGPLACFLVSTSAWLLGMAAGAAMAGRLADGTGRPLALFALGSTGAGLLGLFTAWESPGGLALRLLAGLEADPGSAAPAVLPALASGIVCFGAACLTGGCVPLMALAAGPHAPARVGAGRMAAASAAGAAIGSVACAFWLMPRMGIRLSLLITSAVMLASGALAAAASRRFDRPATRTAGPRAGEDRFDASSAARVLLLMFIAGLACMTLETGWVRLGSLTFGSTAQAGSLVLAAAVAGLAAGSALAGRAAARSAGGSASLALACAAASSSLLLVEPLAGRLPILAVRLSARLSGGDLTGAGLTGGHLTQLALLILLVGPPFLLLGALFPLACQALGEQKRFAGSARILGAASAASSLGWLAGAPLAYFGLLPRGGARSCLLASALVLGAASLLVRPRLLPPARRRAIALGSAGVLLLAVGRLALGSWDADLLSSGPYLYGALYAAEGGAPGMLREALRARGELVFQAEGPDGLVTVRRQPGGQISLQVNGKTDASTGGDLRTQGLTAHLPLLLHPLDDPARVMVIGLGSGITAAAALSHPVGLVEVVEISPQVAAAAPAFTRENRGALDDPRTRLILRDARRFLLLSDRRYDVIASQPSNPWISGQAILFSREFFELVRSRLEPAGVFCQWVQGHGLEPEDFRAILATFVAVFPHSSLWEESTAGGDYLILGSARPFLVEPSRLAARFALPSVQADLARLELSSPAELLSLQVTDSAGLRDLARGAPIQSADRLWLEFSAPRALHRETLGGILKLLEPVRHDPALPGAADPELAGELSRLARRAARERRWAEGLGLLESTGRPDPDLLRAASFLKGGMRDSALRSTRALLQRRPSDRLAHLMLAHLLMSRLDGAARGEAIHHLSRAVDLDPEDHRARLFLSRALFAADRVPEALQANRAALAGLVEPAWQAEAASDRCALLLAGGDVASAEALCRRALGLDPRSAEAHANLGVARSRRGRLAEAEESYRTALLLDPALVDARFNLAALMERQQRPGEGLTLLRPLLAPGGGADAPTLRLAARLAMQAGRPEEARGWLAASLALDPENEEAAGLSRRLYGDRR